VNNLQDGLAHNIQAAASDTEGNVGLSTEVIFTIAENEDIIDPTVTIINPQPGQTVEGNVRILAIAEDERSIQKVEFYIDGDSVGLATLSPYSYNWNTTPFADSTNHTIFAKAFDGGNNKTTSSAVTVTVYPRSVPTDITTPIVSILYPVSGLIISGIVNIIAEAIDDLEVEQVQFYVDGALISTDSDGSNGWSYNWNTTLFADGGTHIIYLKAYDVSGNTGLSAPISVTVPVINDITPPTALVLYPVNGSTVSGIVNITADVTDDVAVSKVEFYIDGKLLSTDTNGTDTWSYNWNTATYNNGQLHSIYLKAYDSSNNIGTSALVTVTVPL